MRVLLYIVVVLTGLLPGLLNAQTVLFEPSRLHYPVTGLPWVVETGDFNNDGNVDFVTASRLERSITLRLGNGDGTFGDSLNYSVGISPRSLIPGDFNEDTNLDVAVANLLSNDVTVLLGDGNGGFPHQNSSAVGDKPRSIIATDFNFDDHLDLAVANRDGNSISILLGNGDGTFVSPIAISTSGDINPRQIRSGDVNNDTVEDIVVVHDEQMGSPNGKKYGVLLGRGDGTFEPITVTIINAGNGFPEAVSLTLGFFDADQNLDMVIGLDNSEVDELVSFKGNGDGTFTLHDEITVGQAPYHLINYDLTKDGFPDIIVANTGSNKITLHTNRGDGTFRNAIPDGDLFDYINGAFRVGDTPRWVTTADVNNDAKIDLLTANEEGNDVSILLGETDTTFVIAPRYSVGGPPQAFPSGGEAADFNGDGSPDLAITNWGFPNAPAEVSVLLGVGDGTFLPKVNYGVGINPAKVIARDFDGDTFFDLAVLNTRDSVFTVLTGNGDGTFNDALDFSLQADPTVLRSMRDMASGDLNEDNREDVVVLNYNEDYLAIFFGNPQTIFDEAVKLFLSDARPLRVFVADFDGDNHQDILVQKDAQFIGQPNTLDVYLGDGNGGFSDPVVNTWAGEITIEVITSDFDDDGVPDVAVLDSKFEITLYTLILFRGNNDGTFTEVNSFELTEPGGLFAHDVVGDKNIDLLVGSYTNSDVKILEGDGSGTFAELWPSYGAETGIRYFTPGDFDSDGDIDLATTGGVFGEAFVSVLINTGNITGITETGETGETVPASFKLEQNYPNPFNPQTVIQYQLPGASEINLAIYNVLGQKVRTLVNRKQEAGVYHFTWDGRNDYGVPVASGVYVYKLEAGDFRQVRKMILLR